MSLFVDDDFITYADMLALDPEVGEIADAEGITVDGDGGIGREAWAECADKILAATLSFSGQGSRVRLNQIVVSDQQDRKISSLRRWMVYTGLVLFYRAAMNRRTNDRYEAKHERALAQAKRTWRVLWQTGLPAVASPLPCPGALHEQDSGDLTNEAITDQPGGDEQETTYRVAVTWVDETAYQGPTARNNGESGSSAILAHVVPQNHVMRVSIDGLAPPRAYQSDQFNLSGVRTATGWNVYVGEVGGPMFLQNQAPLPLTQIQYTLPGAPTLSGHRMGKGQVAEYFVPLHAVLSRG